MRWALEEARLRRARLDVVHAWQATYVVPSPFMGVALDPGLVEKQAGAVLDRIFDAEDMHHVRCPLVVVP